MYVYMFIFLGTGRGLVGIIYRKVGWLYTLMHMPSSNWPYGLETATSSSHIDLCVVSLVTGSDQVGFAYTCFNLFTVPN